VAATTAAGNGTGNSTATTAASTGASTGAVLNFIPLGQYFNESFGLFLMKLKNYRASFG
jgi:hypothetical protein